MFKKYPFIKQEGLKDCGAACVWMIIKFYNGYIGINKLDELLKTTRKGVTAYHIVNALEDCGFRAYGMKQDKLDKTRVPFITNIIIRNSYRHFIVVYEVTDSYVLIADPASKIRKVSLDNFYKVWTGVNIFMYPVKRIVRMKSNFDFLSFMKMAIYDRKILFVVFFLSVIMVSCGVVCSFFLQFLIENMRNDESLRLICIVFIFLFLIKVFSDFYRNKVLIKFVNSISSNLTKKTFKHIIELPYLYYQNHTSGEVTSKINDLTIVSNTINKILLIVFVDLPLTIFSGILLFLISKTLFIISFISILFYVLIIACTHKYINASIENTLRSRADVNSYMTESIGGFETIKGLGIENRVTSILNLRYDSYFNEKVKLENLVNKQLLFKNLVGNIGQVFIMIIGIIMIRDDLLSLGLFITFTFLLSLFLEPIRNIIDLDFEIKEAVNAIKRVGYLYENSQEKINEYVNFIEFKNLSFSFDDINYAVKDINLCIKKGEKILVTGESGSGKSTFVKLLKGYFSKYEGELLINSKGVCKINDSVVYLSQKEKIFTGTIYDNLILKGSKDLDKIKQICFIDEFVCLHTLGYHTLLEEDGFNISGGQRQRIALARALQDFSILIIDEGFSGLDISLERKIIKNLFEYYSDKTFIVISHRLGNLDLFDRFIKFDGGMITLDETKNGKDW